MQGAIFIVSHPHTYSDIGNRPLLGFVRAMAVSWLLQDLMGDDLWEEVSISKSS